MSIIITVLHVVACFVLIVVVLLQTGKGADIGAVFGGSSQTIFGSSGAGNLLTRLTTWTAVIFMVTSLALTWSSTHHLTSSIADTLPDEPPPLAAPIDGGAAAPADEAAPAEGAAAAPAGDAAPAAEAAAPALPGIAAGATLPAILQVEGARDPLHDGASVVRVSVARANASGVACVEFDAAMVAGRPSRLGTAPRAGANAASCAGEPVDVQAGPSTASLFAVTVRSGPIDGVIGRVTLRDARGEVAARPIERAEAIGAFAAMPADFRIAYIEARLTDAAASGKTDALRALLPLAEALPDSPVARDLLARVRSAARP